MLKGSLTLALTMETLSCKDVGCDCDYIAKGETEENVMKDAAPRGMNERAWTDGTRHESNER